MSKLFFTADTHWNHTNVIKYCNRPFSSIEEMNNTLIENWNSVINPGDLVYHLGDFAFAKSTESVEDYIRKLNGNIYLICGNHDRKSVINASGFVWIKDYAKIKIGNQKIILCHYAFRVWECKHYGSYHLYGHSHGTLPDIENEYSIDVGVDSWNFYPVSYDQIEERMKAKNITI